MCEDGDTLQCSGTIRGQNGSGHDMHQPGASTSSAYFGAFDCSQKTEALIIRGARRNEEGTHLSSLESFLTLIDAGYNCTRYGI